IASGCSAWTMSERMPARGKQRSRLTRQTMLPGPKRPSSAGTSGTAFTYALASGSSGLSLAVSITDKIRSALRQDLLPLREVLDRLGADLLEAAVQALAQDAGAGRGRIQPGDENEVRPLLVEAQGLRNVLRREHHPRVGRLG